MPRRSRQRKLLKDDKLQYQNHYDRALEATPVTICLPEFDWLKTKYFVFVQQSLQLINQSFNLYTAP